MTKPQALRGPDFCASRRRSLLWSILLPVVLASALLIGGVMSYLPDFVLSTELRATRERAMATAEQLLKLRAFYSDNAVSKVTGVPGVAVAPRYVGIDHTLPAPTTFLADFAQYASGKGRSSRCSARSPGRPVMAASRSMPSSRRRGTRCRSSPAPRSGASTGRVSDPCCASPSPTG